MSNLYQVTPFRAEQLQKLRNVRMHSPCIIQVVSGSKRLFWRESALVLTPSNLLLCEATSSLSFENLPSKGHFLSRVFSFHYPPCDATLDLSKHNATKSPSPIYGTDKALEVTLDLLSTLDLRLFSQETQIFWLNALYQQLAERGILHHLFSKTDIPFSQRLSRYLAHNPSDENTLETSAQHFAISRSTLIRKLKQENTKYKDVLIEVRLNHALYLMQNDTRNIAMLAQMCGYQSEGRFSQRFKEKFGISPSEYLKTIAN